MAVRAYLVVAIAVFLYLAQPGYMGPMIAG